MNGISFTFKGNNPGIRVHESRVSSDWASQRLHGHAHVNDHNTVLRPGFPHANVLVRFHRHVRERHELRVDPNASQLQQPKRRIAKLKNNNKKNRNVKEIDNAA